LHGYTYLTRERRPTESPSNAHPVTVKSEA